MKELNVQGIGIALGSTWALGLLLLGFAAAFFDYGIEVVDLLSGIYIGYGPTITGAIIGAVWAFIDAYIAGIVLVWIYNKFLNREV